ncbi:MAG: hypothetical protein LBT32_10130 [Peptococcaceae bacterium]|jgi:hypothetical protein|nr:hypothetical protein [Peptococcaceae bacterium]
MKSQTLFAAMGNIDDKFISEEAEDIRATRSNSIVAKAKNVSRPLRRFAPIAACLALAIALTVVLGQNAGWFGSRVYTADLGSHGTLNFYPSAAVGADSLDFGVDVTSRNLTEDELSVLFSHLPETSAYGLFHAANKNLLHVEGHSGHTKIILSAPGLPTVDSSITGHEAASELNGVPVSAGYFITKENSQGIKNIIYFAFFSLGDVPVYVECGGVQSENEALKSEIALVIAQLIQNGTLGLSVIPQ